MANSSEPTRLGVREFRAKLSHYLSRAQGGETFTILSRGKPVAELRAPADLRQPKAPRVLGALEGKVHMEPGWDEWPEDVLKSFEAPL